MINTNLNLRDLSHSLYQTASSKPDLLLEGKVEQIKQQDSDPKLKAYDEAKSKHQKLWVRMSGKLQERERALFKADSRINDLLQEISDITLREKSLNDQIEKVTNQFEASRGVISGLEEQVNQLQTNLARAVAATNDANQRSDAAQNRSNTLIERLRASEREVNVVRRIPLLERNLKKIDAALTEWNMKLTNTLVFNCAVVPLAVPYGLTFLAPILGPAAVSCIAASSVVTYALYRGVQPDPKVKLENRMEEDYFSVINKKMDICYEIIEIRMGITKDEFLSKSVQEKNQIFSELGFGLHTSTQRNSESH